MRRLIKPFEILAGLFIVYVYKTYVAEAENSCQRPFDIVRGPVYKIIELGAHHLQLLVGGFQLSGLHEQFTLQLKVEIGQRLVLKLDIFLCLMKLVVVEPQGFFLLGYIGR